MSETVTIEIFDPPMCCASGLCGPAIDPALLDISEAILRLKNERQVSVARYLLQRNGAKFMQNPEVLSVLKTHGTGALPLTAVNGTVVKRGKYPTYEELLSYAESSRDTSADAATRKE